MEISNYDFAEEFIAVPNDGYAFLEWRTANRHLCSGLTGNCQFNLSTMAGFASAPDSFLNLLSVAIDLILGNPDEVYFIAPEFNQIPSIELITNIDTVVEDSIVLTASVVDDDDQLSYDWVQLSGPEIELSVSSDDSVSFDIPASAGGASIVVELTVTDSNQLAGTAITEIRVAPTINMAAFVGVLNLLLEQD